MIPKSLHTVTALVNVARLYLTFGNTLDAAIAGAVATLGYQGAPDVYGLVAKARAILARGAL